MEKDWLLDATLATPQATANPTRNEDEADMLVPDPNVRTLRITTVIEIHSPSADT